MSREPIRVLHLFEHYLPTTMNWAWRLLRHTQGVAHDVAAPVQYESAFRSDDFQFLLPDYIGRLPASEHEVGMRLRLMAAADRWFGGYRRQLRRYVEARGVQVIHAHFAQVACRFLPFLEQWHGPLVVSFYGFDYEMLPHTRPQYRSLYRRVFERADAVLCEGQHGVAVLSAMGCPSEKLRVQHLGFDSSVSVSATRSKPVARLRLIQAATFTEKKGHIYTIAAFAEALRDCPNMSLTLVGEPYDGKVVEEVRRLIVEKGLNEQVQILSLVPFAAFYDLLMQFDVMIQPSTYAANRDCEGGAPVGLIDAQSRGLPIIATRHCDIPEVVAHGHTGLLSGERDIEGLAESIRTFYRMSPDTFSAFSAAAQAHVRMHYDLGVCGRQLSKYYQNLIEGCFSMSR